MINTINVKRRSLQNLPGSLMEEKSVNEASGHLRSNIQASLIVGVKELEHPHSRSRAVWRNESTQKNPHSPHPP